MPRPPIDLYILDAVADDVEEGAHVAERVSRWNNADVSEIPTSLMRLVHQGLIEACALASSPPALVPTGIGTWPVGPWQEQWFRITPRGLMILSAWKPADDEQAV